MQLIIILLAVVGLLTFSSGIIVLFGTLRANRARSIWYFLAATFAACWMSTIAMFLTAGKDALADYITTVVSMTFVCAIMLDVTFLGFSAWDKIYGKFATFFFLVFGVILSGTILLNPDMLYSDIILSNAGNSVLMNYGPLYYTYIAFFCAVVPVICFALFRQYRRARSKRNRHSNIIAMAAFGISSLITMIANLVLPVMDNWTMIWMGPLAISTVILVIYYLILRYQALNLSFRWLKFFSYIVVVASIAIVYMIIFSIVFAALFRGSTPSIEVIILNFIMILIFIALMPAMNGLIRFIRSLVIEKHPREAAKMNFGAGQNALGVNGASKITNQAKSRSAHTASHSSHAATRNTRVATRDTNHAAATRKTTKSKGAKK